MQENNPVCKLKDAFNPSKDFFDETITESFQQNAQALAKTYPKNQFYQEIANNNLNKLCKDKPVKNQVQNIWNILCQSDELNRAYVYATDAYRSNENAENRATQFIDFTRIGTQELQKLAGCNRTTMFKPSNKELQISFLKKLLPAHPKQYTPEEKTFLISCIITQAALWQVRRHLDAESDNPKLIDSSYQEKEV